MQTVLAKDTVKRDSPGHWCVAAVGGEIMVCEWENMGAIKVYNNQLEYIREITPKNTDCGDSDALSSDEHGNLYASISEGILVMSRSGDMLRFLGCDGQRVGKLNDPVGVCVSGQYVYTSDHNNVVIFTTEGEYVTSFGEEGDKEGEFKYPVGLCVDKDGFLYVCDTFNDRIQIF